MRRAMPLLALAAFALLALAPAARAGLGVTQFGGQVVADTGGAPFTQAGGHPYAISFQIGFETFTHPLKGPLWPVESIEDLVVELPPGLVGDPTVVAQCTMEQIAGPKGVVFCPSDAQVGFLQVTFNAGQPSTRFPVYSMVPPPDVPARFAASVGGTIVVLDAQLRSEGDYGLSVAVRNAPQVFAIAGASVTLWGYPADERHDAERACPGGGNPLDPILPGDACETLAPVRPFLRLPTACPPAGTVVGLETWLHASSWEDRAAVTSASFALPATTDCEQVPFGASLEAAPASPARAGEPSGFAFEVSIPQGEGAVGQGDVRSAVVTLPEGVRISPPAAAGLAGCAPAQIALASAADAACPDASRLGSLTIETPLLDEPLTGGIYLAAPRDNPFDSLLALYLVARGPGLVVKLAGEVEADPVAGRLTVSFRDTPQLPFSRLRLTLDDGSRSALVLPRACGRFVTRARLTSWSGRVVDTESAFDVACPATGDRFSPRFAAWTANPVARAHTSFVLQLSRDDADAELGSLAVDLPRGLLARIAGVPRCDAVRADRGTCGAGSRIGSVLALAGAGRDSLPLRGEVFLAGPYRGAPFSLSIVVPAVAGPFDLGTEVVRASVFVHRRSAALHVVTDPLPTILEGIPLQVRAVQVGIDRPRFMLNPSSCDEHAIKASIHAAAGASASKQARFQVGECARLPFRPRIRLKVSGPGMRRVGAPVSLTATVTQSPGEAGIKSVYVSLPPTLAARLEVVEQACTQAEFDSNDCDQARIGSATARTPLLKEVLTGGVFLVRDPGQPLPDIVVALRGEVDVDLPAKVSISGGRRLAARIPSVPDVPLTRFTLRLDGGAGGVLGVGSGGSSGGCRRSSARVRLQAWGDSRFAGRHIICSLSRP